MTLRRLGRKADADKVLERITEDMDVIENYHYHKCLMMYKGKNTPEKLMEEAYELGDLGLVTIGYGVANWYQYNGDLEKAGKILGDIVSVVGWAGFGYIAAEADLHHLGLSA
jgi:hypothetical protein